MSWLNLYFVGLGLPDFVAQFLRPFLECGASVSQQPSVVQSGDQIFVMRVAKGCIDDQGSPNIFFLIINIISSIIFHRDERHIDLVGSNLNKTTRAILVLWYSRPPRFRTRSISSYL